MTIYMSCKNLATRVPLQEYLRPGEGKTAKDTPPMIQHVVTMAREEALKQHWSTFQQPQDTLAGEP